MIRSVFPLLLLSLAACSQNAGTDGSEDDFAARVGTASAPAAQGAAAPVANAAAKGPPPAGANIFAPEKLGDISAVDLGPRAGGCTFSAAGNEMLIAAGSADRALPGKGVVRIGGKLIELDTPPGGIEAIKAGTSFTGEGFSVRVQPTAKGKGTITITDAKGQTKAIAGDWLCA